MIVKTPWLLLYTLIFTSLQAQVNTEVVYEDGIIIQKTTFNKDGNIIESDVLISEDNWYEELNEYKDTLLIHSNHYLNGLIIAEYEYQYNKNNMLGKRLELKGDSIGVISEFKYNINNQITNEQTFENNVLLISIEYEYYEDGKISARIEKLYDNEITIYNNQYFEYDDNGLLKKRVQMSGIDTLVCHTYSYDNLNRCEEITVRSGGEIINRITWSYVKDSDKIKRETHFSNGYIVRQEKHKYNSKGLLKRNIVFDYRVFENIPGQKKVVYKHKYTYFND